MRSLAGGFVVAALVLGIAQGENIISSPVITSWGVWGDFTNCTQNKFAEGFQLKTEKAGFNDGDETALNAIRIFCGNPEDADTVSVTSSEGVWGVWGDKYTCNDNQLLTGFQMRSEAPSDWDDETAANNVRFFCSSRDPGTPQNQNDFIEGDGREWGEWTDAQHCPAGEAICGIKTQVEPEKKRNGDMTALNNVIMKCCPVQQ